MTQVIHIEGRCPAPPSAVFAVLIDTARWPEWSPMDTAELEQPAEGDQPEGVGAIRRFKTGRTVSRERVVAFEVDRAFSYELLSGLPLKDYRADVTLTPHPDGWTTVTWHSEFTGRRPGTGWFYRLALQRFIAKLMDQLCVRAAASTAV